MVHTETKEPNHYPICQHQLKVDLIGHEGGVVEWVMHSSVPVIGMAAMAEAVTARTGRTSAWHTQEEKWTCCLIASPSIAGDDYHSDTGFFKRFLTGG